MEERPSERAVRRAGRLAFSIGLGYALLGIAWILLSDALVAAMFADTSGLLTAQRYKGVAYVLVTALALVALVRSGSIRILRANSVAEARELQVQDLFLKHPKPMWIYDPTSMAFLKVNDAAIDFYGYSEPEFLSLTLHDIRPEEDKEHFRAVAKQPIDRYREIGRARHRKKSGENVFMHITAHTVSYAGRAAVMVMALDVTEEVKVKDALQRQEQEFRQLHQSLSSVLWLARAADLGFVYISPAFETLFGWSSTRLMADPTAWQSAILPGDLPAATSMLRQVEVAGAGSAEYRIVRPDGTIRWLSDRRRVILDDAGRPRLVGGIAEDITPMKELEAERASAQQHLERMVAQRTAQLEQVNIELEAFTRTAAHDLRSPLRNIAGAYQFLHERCMHVLDADARQLLGSIERSTAQMGNLINDLLALSHISHHELSGGDVDLASTARAILLELRQQEPLRQVLFRAPHCIRVHCDPGLARSLLANLLGNAWKFTRGKAEAIIEMTARPGDGTVTIRIEDNGVGFSANPAQLFRPFQRFHSSSEFEGTGVGLVTCQRIVQRHGGTIAVDSSPGQGTVVTFTLPDPTAMDQDPEPASLDCPGQARPP